MRTFLVVVVTLVFMGLVAYLLYWLIDQIPVAPFQVVARVLLAVAIVVFLVGMLFGYIPLPNPAWLGSWR